ncbi:DNA polymerase III subunit delta' C-terminal domain-containing protein [[Pasteurella] aerogenes]
MGVWLFFYIAFLFQQLYWLSGFFAYVLKAKLWLRYALICQEVVWCIEQFNQKQTVLVLLRANQIISQVRADLLQINGDNQELMVLDGLTKLVTEVFEENDKQEFF